MATVTADGARAAGGSNLGSISADGHYVVFYSFADTLVSDDANGVGDIYVRDLVAGVTSRVNVASDGRQANSASGVDNPAQISADGRYVAFDSFASNLISNDTNDRQDVFVHDRNTGGTTRVSVANDGTEGDAAGGGSMAPAVSTNGRFVAFASHSTNLVANDTNNVTDIFVRDQLNRTTTRVSIASDGTQSDVETVRPSISADGRFVTFEGWGAHLVPNDTNNATDIFVRDRVVGSTVRVSVSPRGSQANGQSWHASISNNGRFIAFQSTATNLDRLGGGDINGDFDIFVKDMKTGKVTRENVTPQGGLSEGFGVRPSLNADGRYIVFGGVDDIVPNDTNGLPDVFLRRR